MKLNDLITKSNEKVLEINKAVRELEVMASRIEVIKKPGLKVAFQEGATTYKLDDLISDNDMARITAEITELIVRSMDEKQKRVEELLGIREPLPFEPAEDDSEYTDLDDYIEVPLDSEEDEESTTEDSDDKLPGDYMDEMIKKPINVPEKIQKKAAPDKDIAPIKHKISPSEVNDMMAAGCSNDEIEAVSTLKHSSIIKYRRNFNKFGNVQGIDTSVKKEPKKAEKSHVKEEPKDERKSLDELANVIRAAIKNGMTIKQIADQYGYTKQEVYQFCIKNRICTTSKEYL